MKTYIFAVIGFIVIAGSAVFILSGKDNGRLSEQHSPRLEEANSPEESFLMNQDNIVPIINSSGNQQKPDVGGIDDQHNSERLGQDYVVSNPISEEGISEQRAIEIASVAVANVSYSKREPITVVHESGSYTVTFPTDKPELQPGERYRGAPYAVQVTLDEKTGEIIKVKMGS